MSKHPIIYSCISKKNKHGEQVIRFSLDPTDLHSFPTGTQRTKKNRFKSPTFYSLCTDESILINKYVYVSCFYRPIYNMPIFTEDFVKILISFKDKKMEFTNE